MPTQITPALLSPYFKGNKFHDAYKETVKQYLDLKVHVDGEYPREIIEEARPNEPDHIKKFRQIIFAEITLPPTGKVLTTLGKIRKSQDWMIKFPDENPSIIKEGETLKDYTETGYPNYGSMTKWAFDVLLKQQEVDANAVCVTMHDLTVPVQAGEYLKPYPYIFNSNQVYDFRPNDYAILLSSETCTYKIGDVEQHNGKVFYVITTTQFLRYHQSGSAFDFELKYEFNHNIGKLPAWRLAGQYWKSVGSMPLFRPRIYPMVPFLKEAVREYSDLQAGVIQHLYLEKWEYEGQDCKTCSGTGKVKNAEGNTVKCKAKNCNGGKMIQSPYQTKTVKRPSVDDPSGPIAPPFMGYVDKPVEIIKIQDERIERHVFKALAAVNMEFLAQSPLATSGESKKYDQDGANTFTYGVGEDLVGNMDKIMYFTSELRYMTVVPQPEKRKELLPIINTPEKLDIVPSEYLINEMKIATEAGVNPVVRREMEVEYANKKFNADPAIRSEATLVLNLDPLPGISEDQKQSRKMNGGITEEDYIVSCNISLFVKEAMFEDKGFMKLPYDKQMEVLRKKAGEKKEQNSAAAKVMAGANEDIDPETGLPKEKQPVA